MMVSAARDHCVFKKYTGLHGLVSKTINDSKMNRLNQMWKCIQVCDGNVTGR